MRNLLEHPLTPAEVMLELGRTLGELERLRKLVGAEIVYGDMGIEASYIAANCVKATEMLSDVLCDMLVLVGDHPGQPAMTAAIVKDARDALAFADSIYKVAEETKP